MAGTDGAMSSRTDTVLAYFEDFRRSDHTVVAPHIGSAKRSGGASFTFAACYVFAFEGDLIRRVGSYVVPTDPLSLGRRAEPDVRSHFCEPERAGGAAIVESEPGATSVRGRPQTPSGLGIPIATSAPRRATESGVCASLPRPLIEKRPGRRPVWWAGRGPSGSQCPVHHDRSIRGVARAATRRRGCPTALLFRARTAFPPAVSAP